MTVEELVAFVATKTQRLDKDSTILAGINWAKDDLCASKHKLLFKRSDITLVPGQVKYTQGGDGLPSDFNMIDDILYVYSSTLKYSLPNIPYQAIEENTINRGFPTGYDIQGTNDLYVGDPPAGTAHTIQVYYYHRPGDYSDDSTTPVFVSEYGNDAYIYGAEFYLWQSVEEYQRAQYAQQLYHKERGQIFSQGQSKGTPVTRPQQLF